MSNEVSKKRPTWPRDNFGWEPEIDVADGEVDCPARSMQGESKLKFVDPNWSVDNVNCNGRELIVYDKTYSVIRWKDDGSGPEEVIPVARDASPPNLKEMNAKIPQSEWRIGLNGQPEPPYMLQRCLEFLDPQNMERLSWPHNVTVVGSSRAADELEGRIKITRRLRGEDVYPLVKLESRHMPTQYNPRGRQRPYLDIIKWVRLGEHGIEYIDVSSPTQARLERFASAEPTKPAQQSVLPMQSVPEVSLSEEMKDEVKF
jgi:hypothetical protein